MRKYDLTVGDDGASIFDTASGVDRRVASLRLAAFDTVPFSPSVRDVRPQRLELAKLFAAAPDLVEALLLFVGDGERRDLREIKDLARAALAKAGVP